MTDPGDLSPSEAAFGHVGRRRSVEDGEDDEGEPDDGERLLDALVEATEAAEELGHQDLANECGRLYQEAGRLVLDDVQN